LILGIESSCDETALALVKGGELLAHAMASQQAHSIFGGVVPEIASREHLRVLDPLLDQVMADAKAGLEDIEAVAVARGPGLLGSLLVGLSFAKGLARGLSIPLIGVNHLHAHLLAPMLHQGMEFPALGLLVSGGHTQIMHMLSATEFEVLGKTLDDAAGEAFDKTAKLLNLPYPGGKFIDEFAAKASPDKHLFPRPYLDNSNLDFSFSGLKTAVAHHVESRPGLRFEHMPGEDGALPNPEMAGELATVCASFNWAVADTLRIKVTRALERTDGVRALVAAGGVAANSMIRETLSGVARNFGLKMILPEPWLCTDNGAMVALAGELLYNAGWVHSLGLDAVPRGREVPWDYRPMGPEVPA
jgi:N6-L-threonylcarbamoyladenine synthase